MIDIKFLRENPDVVKENIKKKFQDEKLPLVDEVIALDADKLQALQEMEKSLRVLLAKGICKNISCEEVHELVDEIYADYAQQV